MSLDNQDEPIQTKLLARKTALTMWRAYAAWVYMIICIYDFLIAPISCQIYMAFNHIPPNQFFWNPLTLQGGGLFHLAYGAILGVSAWGKMQENTALINNIPSQSQTIQSELSDDTQGNASPTISKRGVPKG